MTNPRSISKTTRFEVFKRDSFTCQYCGRKAPDVILEIEHVHPVSLGGQADILNLVTSCESCNDGKGVRTLDDNAVLEKQRRQVEYLQVRREQIEMMLEWREGLRELDEDTAHRVAEYARRALTPYELTPSGLAGIRRMLGKYTVDEITSAIDISVRQYIEYDGDKPTAESVQKAWEYVSRIAGVRRREQKTPGLGELFYIRGIVRKRCSYFNENVSMELLRMAHDLGADIDELKDIARTCRNWSSWKGDMESLVDGLLGPKP